MDFQIYLSEVIPLKVKQDFDEFSDVDSEQGYILTRCMFDVLLNLLTAEKSQVILYAACGKEAEMITVHGVFQGYLLCGSTVCLIIAVIVNKVKIACSTKFVRERKSRKTPELRTCK